MCVVYVYIMCDSCFSLEYGEGVGVACFEALFQLLEAGPKAFDCLLMSLVGSLKVLQFGN